MKFDVTIVGAGPAGSTVAEAVSKKGYTVLVLEEHPKIGIPQHCSGKISSNALKELGLPQTGMLQEIKGATFYSPDMNFLSVKRQDTQAYIFDRAVLDSWLAKKATDAGATLLTGSQPVDISISPQAAKITFKHNRELRQTTSRLVVGADGAASSTARRLGLYSKDRSLVKVAVQREIAGLHDINPEFVEVYLGNKYAPGFFAWIIPTGKDTVKAGLCVNPSQSSHLIDYLEAFTAHHPIASRKLAGGRCMGQVAHIIPTGGALLQTVCEGALIVGDAAGQVKSTTGGGFYYGMVCARIAGQVVLEALSSGNGLLRKAVLRGYQEKWRERLGREIARSVKLRLFLDSLTDDELSYLFNILRNSEELVRLIEVEGDIDWQSNLSSSLYKHVAGKVVKRPQLLLKLGKSLLH